MRSAPGPAPGGTAPDRSSADTLGPSTGLGQPACTATPRSEQLTGHFAPSCLQKLKQSHSNPCVCIHLNTISGGWPGRRRCSGRSRSVKPASVGTAIRRPLNARSGSLQAVCGSAGPGHPAQQPVAGPARHGQHRALRFDQQTVRARRHVQRRQALPGDCNLAVVDDAGVWRIGHTVHVRLMHGPGVDAAFRALVVVDRAAVEAEGLCLTVELARVQPRLVGCLQRRLRRCGEEFADGGMYPLRGLQRVVIAALTSTAWCRTTSATSEALD